MINKVCCLFFATMVTVLLFSSCEKNNATSAGACYVHFSGSPSENPNWYSEIDNAITNKELMRTLYIDRYHSRDIYAERSYFVASDGGFATNDKNCGRFEDTICWSGSGYEFIDGETLAKINLCLFVDEDFTLSSQYSKVKTVYHGTNFKSISWYISRKYYTYVKNGSKIIVANGTILTEMNGAIIPDGSSLSYQKYDLDSLK